MSLIDIQVIEGVLSDCQKQDMIRHVTDAMVTIEGEAMRGLTWVRIHEVPSGQWGVGGQPVSSEDIKMLTSS